MNTKCQNKNSASAGIAGLGTMGKNLAANMAGHNIKIAVWDTNPNTGKKFLQTEKTDNFIYAKSARDFILSIKKPRIVILMITAEAVDSAIKNFISFMDRDDILIDAGNSWYKNTIKRESLCQKQGIHFMGMGVSGGEHGARVGPSLMPGGSVYAYNAVKPILTKIAAVTKSGPCVTHVGTDGAGHFVKMVHNGIEYAQMQLIAEAFHLLSIAGQKSTDEISDIFNSWNKGPLSSLLLDLAALVLKVKDKKTGNPLIEMIMDKAGQKGTGAWAVKAALDLGVPVPAITAAVDARLLSSLKKTRVTASKIFSRPNSDFLLQNKETTIEKALLAAQIISYAQGMSLIKKASDKFSWNINLKEIIRIWKGGCIIRAALLDDIMDAFDNQFYSNLLLDRKISDIVNKNIQNIRMVVKTAVEAQIPLPVTSAALNYFDAFRTALLPQNLIQAQRDAFGAHKYQRTDDPDGAFIHFKWPVK
jgi:6-phosphogluconate dehydrogenase